MKTETHFNHIQTLKSLLLGFNQPLLPLIVRVVAVNDVPLFQVVQKLKHVVLAVVAWELIVDDCLSCSRLDSADLRDVDITKMD